MNSHTLIYKLDRNTSMWAHPDDANEFVNVKKIFWGSDVETVHLLHVLVEEG